MCPTFAVTTACACACACTQTVFSFAAKFPLTTELWEEWIQDKKAASRDGDYQEVLELYRSAFEDYQCAKLWPGYLSILEESIDVRTAYSWCVSLLCCPFFSFSFFFPFSPFFLLRFIFSPYFLFPFSSFEHPCSMLDNIDCRESSCAVQVVRSTFPLS